MPEVFSLETLTLALPCAALPARSRVRSFSAEELREVSAEYWTPLRVAVRAAGWLEELGIGSVVDIGAGVGKFVSSRRWRVAVDSSGSSSAAGSWRQRAR